MPELPEVEGIRRRLAPHLVGRPIERLDVRDAKLWHPAEGLAAAAVAGRAVRALERRAKLLIFGLDGALALVLHLKIAGQLVYEPPDGQRLVGGHPYPLPGAALPDTSTRFVLAFRSGTLYVNDQRRFAWLRLLPEEGVQTLVAGQRYGPDPLEPAFTPEVLAARLRARKGRPVKAALLDQTCIAGLGSIYADEALHRARLHPLTRSGALTAEHVARLHQAIRDVLEVAVPVGGAIVKAGRAVPERESGRDFLRAHGRAGLPCLDCPPTDQAGGAPDAARGPAGDAVGRGRIARAVIAGRGTYFCPVCQPPPA